MIANQTFNNYLVRLDENNPTLTELNLEKMGIDNEQVKAFAVALSKNTTLTKLSLGFNNIGSDGAHCIANALTKNTTLTELSIRGNRIRDYGAKDIAEALQINTTLTSLDVSKNEIGDEGAEQIAKALKTNNTLTRLNLSGCGIGDSGSSHIDDALQVNKALTMLNLSENKISDDGAGNLAGALHYNRTLTTLYLENNPIGIKTVNTFTEIWKQNGMLLAVHLGPRLHLTTEYSNRNWNAHDRVKEAMARPENQQRGAEIWATRADPKWWTEEERIAAGFSPGPTKKFKVESCIQCLNEEARFHELNAPTRLFCSSYCQWLAYTGVPDLRRLSLQ